ncbi:hypothetical protein LINPERPRIM_LOCUS40699 [Linum perenne]
MMTRMKTMRRLPAAITSTMEEEEESGCRLMSC